MLSLAQCWLSPRATPQNTEWGSYSEEAVGKADILAVFSRKVLLLTFTWASSSLIWLVTVRALMCSTRGPTMVTLLPSYSQGPRETTHLQDMKCILRKCCWIVEGKVQNSTLSAVNPLSRLFLLWIFNGHLKGVFIILITWINHKPSLVDNIAIKATDWNVPAGMRTEERSLTQTYCSCIQQTSNQKRLTSHI